jgi:IclR family transcriptional regulator, acetate operon repressor
VSNTTAPGQTSVRRKTASDQPTVIARKAVSKAHAGAQTKAGSPSGEFAQPRATERGLGLVSIIGDHPTGITLADAARASELMPSTALRQLRSLASMGFAIQREDAKWVPGPELLRLARTLIDYATIGNLSQPTLAGLASATGESAYIAEQQSPTSAMYVAMEQSRHAVRHVSWLGQTLDCRTTAVGAALRDKVDADGVSLRHDAVEPGVTAISAPIRGEGQSVVAAISVVGPTYRLEAFGLAKARLLVAEAALKITELLHSR